MGGRWYGPEERVQDRQALASAAREALGPWLASVRPWELFGTLTYDPVNFGFVRGEWRSGQGGTGEAALPGARAPVKGGRRRAYVPSQWKARRDLEFWFRDGERELGRPLVGVGVVELHASGWPHLHVLVDTGGLQHGDIQKLGLLWFRRGQRGLGGGYNRLEVPRSQEDVTAYCGKYVTKVAVEQLVIFGRLEQRRLAVGAAPGRHRRTRRS